MKVSLVSVSAILLLLFAVTACTPSGGSGGNEPGRRQFLGDLDKKVGEIYGPANEPDFQKCDLDWKDQAMEISRALESRRSEIEAFAKSYVENGQSNEFDLVTMGRFSFRQLKKPVGGVDQWNKETSSWKEAYLFFQKIKDKPVDEDWVALNSYVRGMVPDEEDRLVYGSNMALNKDAGPLVNTIHDKIQSCLDQAACTVPTLEWNEIYLLNQSLAESWYINRLTYTTKDSFEKRREYLGKLQKLIRYDKVRYSFRPSEIFTLNGKQLEVPMDLRAFGGAAAQFIQYVESIWNVDSEFTIKIVQKNSPLPAYVVEVGDLVGERASVSGKKMQLYNFGHMKTLAHEFGHVIGFRDNYYTTWDGATCAYTYEINEGDMMSDHLKGRVLPRHWAEIKKAYWKQ